VHATLRAVPSLVSLRRERLFRSLRTAIERAHKVPSFRIVQFSVQSNHVHLIVEAAHKTALARGMQGLAIRLALTYNRVCVHRGSVWTERYHARELASPRQVRNAFVYVLQNRTQYVRTAAGTIDPCSSAPWFTGWARPPLSFHELLVPCPVLPAATWLASRGWRVHGLIDPDEVPLAARRPGAEVRRASRSSPPG
jgi:REP element-mobilizing transposase RayT